MNAPISGLDRTMQVIVNAFSEADVTYMMRVNDRPLLDDI
jgi:hypothetical protein